MCPYRVSRQRRKATMISLLHDIKSYLEELKTRLSEDGVRPEDVDELFDLIDDADQCVDDAIDEAEIEGFFHTY